MRLFAIALVVVALGAGCVHKYEVPTGSAPRTFANAVLYVVVPEPGSFEGQIFPESGTQVARAVSVSLQSRASRVALANGVAAPDENLKVARAMGATQVVVARILHWEERATEWSGKPDRIRIQLDLIDVATGATLDSSEIAGKSRWATLGGDHPQALLPEPLDVWARRLFGLDAD